MAKEKASLLPGREEGTVLGREGPVPQEAEALQGQRRGTGSRNRALGTRANSTGVGGMAKLQTGFGG